MRRIATLGVAGCTLLVMTCWAREVAVACITDLFPELGARAARIDRQRQELEGFGTRFDAIANEVALGRQSLREASKALEHFALKHHPTHFQYLEAVDGSSVPTKLARQMLTHLKFIGPHDPARQVELVRELEEMLAEATPP